MTVSISIYVYVEDSDGRFYMYSRHRSGTAAERAFRECRRMSPSLRSFVVDLSTGERKQYDGAGHVMGPFRWIPKPGWCGCQAGSDGECDWDHCPQVADDESHRSGRHCPLDRDADDD